MGKKGGNTVAIVEQLARPIVEEQGLRLWDVRFEKEGADWYLRIVLDGDNGITLNECEAVSRPLSKLLDEADPIEQAYYLEVSSPGTERELKKSAHFEACLGENIRVRLIRPLEGKREFTGVLLNFENGRFLLNCGEKEQEFVLTDCSFVKLVDDFDLDSADENQEL